MKLAELGFRRFCCDDFIAEKLSLELRQANGTSSSLAEWMGFPYEPQYSERESRYLALEIESLNEILEDIESCASHTWERMVIDTTGSVIYTGKKVLMRLRQYTTVVHLSTPPEVKERMLQSYVTRPRPVLWRDVFSRKPDETNEEALARCYPRLLFARERLYGRYADVSVDYHKRNEESFGVNDLLEEIKKQAGKQLTVDINGSFCLLSYRKPGP